MMSTSRYGDMEAFAAELRAEGYEQERYVYEPERGYVDGTVRFHATGGQKVNGGADCPADVEESV